jgi:hypothetical protein
LAKRLEKLTLSSVRNRQRTNVENELKKENTTTTKPKTVAVRVQLEIAVEKCMLVLDSDAAENF